jgi:hypothetical protein
MAEVEAVPDLRQYLRGTQVTLTVRFYDDGNAVDPGMTTIGAVNAHGDVIVPAGTATAGSGVLRTFLLTTTHTNLLNLLTVTLTTATYGALAFDIEVLGAYLFTLRDLRAFEDRALANQTTYPARDIDRTRAQLTDELQSVAGVSFVPRSGYEIYNGTGKQSLFLAAGLVRGLRSIEQRALGLETWTALSTAELADVDYRNWAELRRESFGVFTYGYANWRVFYDHGYDRPPGLIPWAAMRLARERLVTSAVSDRFLSVTTEMGTEQYAVANEGLGRHFGIPPVDAVIQRWSVKVPAVG